MAIIDSSTWYRNKDTGWTNVRGSDTLGFGSGYELVWAERNEKRIRGSGVSINNLGFWRTEGALSADGVIYQIEMVLPKNSTVIAEISLSPLAGLQGLTAPSFLFRSSVPDFKLLDSNGAIVSGGTTISQVLGATKYTLKFKINSDGTLTGYYSLGSTLNAEIGTTTLANNLLDKALYLSAQATLIDPAGAFISFDNYYVHDEGLNFVVPEPSDLDLDTFSFGLKDMYPEDQTHMGGIYEKKWKK